MLTVFWGSKGILLVDFLDHGCTINGPYYADLLGKLREALLEKKRGKVIRDVLPLTDIPHAHKSTVNMSIMSCGFEL